MTEPMFSKRLLSGVLGFLLGFFAFIPIHFWMLSRHTKDIEQEIRANKAMIERLEINKLCTLQSILSKYREEIKQMEYFNFFMDLSNPKMGTGGEQNGR